MVGRDENDGPKTVVSTTNLRAYVPNSNHPVHYRTLYILEQLYEKNFKIICEAQSIKILSLGVRKKDWKPMAKGIEIHLVSIQSNTTIFVSGFKVDLVKNQLQKGHDNMTWYYIWIRFFKTIEVNGKRHTQHCHIDRYC